MTVPDFCGGTVPLEPDGTRFTIAEAAQPALRRSSRSKTRRRITDSRCGRRRARRRPTLYALQIGRRATRTGPSSRAARRMCCDRCEPAANAPVHPACQRTINWITSNSGVCRRRCQDWLQRQQVNAATAASRMTEVALETMRIEVVTEPIRFFCRADRKTVLERITRSFQSSSSRAGRKPDCPGRR